jgi:hypothetical protein
MSITDLVALGGVVSMFASFMAVLGGVAWWSEQPVKQARAQGRPSGRPSYAPNNDTDMDLAA